MKTFTNLTSVVKEKHPFMTTSEIYHELKIAKRQFESDFKLK